VGLTAAFRDGGAAFTDYMSARLLLANLILLYPTQMVSSCQQSTLGQRAEAVRLSAVDTQLAQHTEALATYDKTVVQNCAAGRLAVTEVYLALYEESAPRLEEAISQRLAQLEVRWDPSTGANPELVATFTEGLRTAKGGESTPPRAKDLRVSECDIMRVDFSRSVLTLSYSYTLTGGFGYYLEGPNDRGEDMSRYSFGQFSIGGQGGVIEIPLPPVTVHFSDRSVDVPLPVLMLDTSTCRDTSF
jgi:hypothetical protein